MMRARPWLGAAVAVLTVGFARPQETPPEVPSGPATIRGRLFHAQRPEAVRGASVVLYALAAEGKSGVRNTNADDEGRFVFEGISNDPHSVYLVGARSGEIPFVARVVFAAGELEQSVELSMSDPTDDASALSVGDVRLEVDRGCTHLHIRQTHELNNGSGAVIYVPEADRSQRQPLLSAEMPEGAAGFETSLGEQGVDFEGRLMRYWGPLYPGEQEIEFGYGIPLADDSAFEIGFPRGAAQVVVITSLDGVRVNGADLEPALLEPHGAGYPLLRYAAGPVSAGESVALSIALSASTPAERLKTRETRIVLELDDAALDVQEQHEIRVSGEAPLPQSRSEPLLCIPLPADAEGLRFSSAALELGLSRDPSGALAVHGPLPGGDTTLAMRYLVPVDGEPVQLERRFGADVPRLSVLIADTGLIARSERLHSLQPVRTEDRSYLHLEGFSIGAEETIALSMRRLSQRRGMPAVATAGLVLLAAAGALSFLIAPLRASGQPADGEDSERSPAALERDAVMRSIRDLDEDFETGKLDAEDHSRLRGELRAQAVALLREEREALPPRPRPANIIRCPHCAVAVNPEDRFCSRCGRRLISSEASGDEGR